MRARALSVFFLLVLAPFAPAGDSARLWLDRAADAKLTLREREYAAHELLMLADSSASILIAALKGEDSDSGLRRQVAAGLLGELDSDAAEAPLVEAAFANDPFLAEAASAALARRYSRLSDGELHGLFRRGGLRAGAVPRDVGADGDDWLALSLDAARVRGRFRAIVMRGLELKYRGGGGPMPNPLAECVWEGLADADADLRFHSIGAAAKTASGEAAERIAFFLYGENDARLLRRALRAMGEMRPSEYAGAVERHVRHADPLVALEALATLDAMGYGRALFPAVPGERAAAAYVAHPSTPVRRRAIEILGASHNPAALDHLATALFDRVGQNRAAAARALGELGFAGAVGGLSPLLNDPRPEVRLEAAAALAKLGVVGIAFRMLDDLEKGELPFRRAAAEALGRIGDAAAVPALTRALGDADAELACLAAESLGLIGSETAGPALYDVMLRRENPVLSDVARKALTVIYREDPGVQRTGWEIWRLRHLERQ